MGADLFAVVNRAFTEVAVNDENISYKHLCTALTQVKPSAIKEVLVQVPNVSFYKVINIIYAFIMYLIISIGQMDRHWWSR